MVVTAIFNVTTTSTPKPEIIHSTGVIIYNSNSSLVPALTGAIEVFPNL